MRLSRYVAPLDFRAVCTHLGKVLQLLAVILLAPLLVALITHEFTYSFIFGGLALGTFVLGRVGAGLRQSELELKEALVVTASAYLLFGVVGALAFLPVASFIDGFFEAISGFTTTGLSVMDVDHLSKSLLFFRAYSQWIGGAGIIVLSLAVLLRSGKAAFQLYAAEFGKENLVGSVVATARAVASIYIFLTMLGFLIFSIVGMQPFDALLHIMATISTGGFSPYSDSIGHYNSTFVETAVIIFMLLGAISFPLYYRIRLTGLRALPQDLELRYMMVIIAMSAVLFLGLWGWQPAELLHSLFRTVSALTTTGFNIETSPWPQDAKLLGVLLMIIGGSAGSTAGGIKLFRLILMVRLAGWLVLQKLLPEEAKLPIKYKDLVISDHELKQVFGFVGLYLGFLLLSALLLSFSGYAVADALFESASALGTVGLSSGITSPSMAPWDKLLLIFDMWAGRLELLTVLVLLLPATWKPRRRSM